MANKGVVAVIVGAALGLAGLVTYLVTRPAEAAASVPLKAGYNQVTYTGKNQTAADAFKSISAYLLVVYQWNPIMQRWDQKVGTDILVSDMILSVNVNRDCTWTY